MQKRILGLAGALTLMIVMITGCKDSQVTSPQTNAITAADPYAVYPTAQDLGNTDDLLSIAAIANDPSLLTPPASDPGGRGGRGGNDDSLHGGGRGGDDTLHHGGDTLHRGGDTNHRGGNDDSLHNGGRGRGGNDSLHRGGDDTLHRGGGQDSAEHRGGNDGPKGPHPDLGRIFQQLQLTDAQAVEIRGCVNELNDCLRTTTERFRQARQNLRDSLQADIRGIEQAVRSGRITAAEGRRLIQAKIQAYRAAAADLEARYNRAINECWTAFDRCVRSHLTDDQIVRWNRLFHL